MNDDRELMDLLSSGDPRPLDLNYEYDVVLTHDAREELGAFKHRMPPHAYKRHYKQRQLTYADLEDLARFEGYPITAEEFERAFSGKPLPYLTARWVLDLIGADGDDLLVRPKLTAARAPRRRRGMSPAVATQ